jgi:nucleoside-diphosphate-sugar epimerase
MKVIITGSRGYVGENLMEIIPDAEGFDIFDGYSNPYDALSIRHLFEDVKPDIVYHLEAVSGISACENDPRRAIYNNVISTLNITENAAKFGVKVVFASSEACDNPVNLYGQTKLIGERLILKANGVVCRISNIWGGFGYLEKKDTVVARLMRDKFEDRGADDEIRDFIHVDEVCKMLIRASLMPSGMYRINTGTKISIRSLKEMSKQPEFPNTLMRPGQLVIGSVKSPDMGLKTQQN